MSRAIIQGDKTLDDLISGNKLLMTIAEIRRSEGVDDAEIWTNFGLW